MRLPQALDDSGLEGEVTSVESNVLFYFVSFFPLKGGLSCGACTDIYGRERGEEGWRLGKPNPGLCVSRPSYYQVN